MNNSIANLDPRLHGLIFPTGGCPNLTLAFSHKKVSSHTCEKPSHCENSHSHSFSHLSQGRKKLLSIFSTFPVRILTRFQTILTVLTQVLTPLRMLLTDFGEGRSYPSIASHLDGVALPSSRDACKPDGHSGFGLTHRDVCFPCFSDVSELGGAPDVIAPHFAYINEPF